MFVILTQRLVTLVAEYTPQWPISKQKMNNMGVTNRWTTNHWTGMEWNGLES
jgi:hypothetical protein